jgi:hypothetical protein
MQAFFDALRQKVPPALPIPFPIPKDTENK